MDVSKKERKEKALSRGFGSYETGWLLGLGRWVLYVGGRVCESSWERGR